MLHSTLARMLSVRAALSLPLMYTWPTPVKRAVLGLCIALCISAYTAIAIELIVVVTLALGLT